MKLMLNLKLELKRNLLIAAVAIALAAVLAVVFTSYSSDDEGDDISDDIVQGIAPSPGNSELVVGPNRFAFGLADENNEPIHEAPGVSVTLRFYIGDELKLKEEAGFTWAIPDVTGFFVVNADFDSPGQWRAEADVVRDGDTEMVAFTFPVLERGSAPSVGNPAPPSLNRTLASEPNIARISTDEDPDRSYYELTVAEALENDRALVVIFATPAFCATRFCGPIVDTIKEVSPAYADRVDFIHIEPFELDDEGKLLTEDLPSGGQNRIPTVPVLEWGLQTEPWVFIVDGDGIIASRFEGAASADEIRRAIDDVLG